MRTFALFLCLFASVVLAAEVKRLDPADPTLTKPLIVDPNALSEADQANVASVAQVLANEPASAKEDPPAADEDGLASVLEGSAATGAATTDTGATDSSSDSSSDSSEDESSSSDSNAVDQSAITKEITLLNSLIEHGKLIAAAIPEKEARLKALSAQLSAAKGQEAAKGAEAKLGEQQLLLATIQLKITALKKKLEDLETTQTKLEASIEKVKAAVNTNDQVTHQLNQEAAVASVGGATSTGAAAPAADAAAAAAAAPAAAFLDNSAVDAVTELAREQLNPLLRFKKHHRK